MSNQEVHNYTCTLSPEDLDKSKRELNEDPNTRSIEIQTLRERLLRYPGLKPRVDDAFLIKFLRPRKFDQERTFELILNFYKMKKENEDMFAEMTPRHIRHVLVDNIVSVLPQRSKNGETIMVFRTENWDVAKHPMDDIFKLSFILDSTLIESEEAQVNGVRFISDLSGLSWSHATAFTPSMAQKMTHMVQDAFPMRVKGVHYVNEPSLFDYVFAIMKPFLKEKLTKRLRFHGTKYEELQEFIDAEHLPQKYGGKLPDNCFKEYSAHVMERQQYFEEEAKFGFVSMTMKQQSKKSVDAMENLPGTFKKLNVD